MCEIPNTFARRLLSRGQKLRYRRPSEDVRPLLPGNLNASLRPWNRSVTSDHHMWLASSGPGIIPAPACSHEFRTTFGPWASWQHLEYCREICALTDLGSFLHGCTARCQTSLEREQVVPTQGSIPWYRQAFHDLAAFATKTECNVEISFSRSTGHTFAGAQNIPMSNIDKVTSPQ